MNSADAECSQGDGRRDSVNGNSLVLDTTLHPQSVKSIDFQTIREGFPIRVHRHKRLEVASDGASNKMAAAGIRGKCVSPRRIVRTCQSSCGGIKMEPVAWLHGETEGKREGDVFKTRMNRCTFTVRPFQQRAASPKGLGRETSNFAILLLKVFFCLGWSVGSGVGGSAAHWQLRQSGSQAHLRLGN